MMDFESPDVEKEFPGLYASESTQKSNESDFSDEGGHDKHSKKELLGSRRKDKRDRKDRGYATLEGESSSDKEQETKSPSKSRKTKAFKFPSKKEKREKSRDKESKDKDVEKDKDKKKDKDKEKSKSKSKDKSKKSKHMAEGLDTGEEQPIFGVSLCLAVERSRCHDGVDLPLIVRDCIDYIEEYGMTIENLYKAMAIKSKIQQLKKLYNQREPVNISEFEPTVATNLLILFLRELPEPILENSETISRFEQAASTKEVAQRESQLTQLVEQLPHYNRILLAWIILHLDHVTSNEKTTKINAQTVSMTLSPVMQMSHRLLLALLFHCKTLFPNVQLNKYIPPLSSVSINLPDTIENISAELAKQESLLTQIHMQMNAGFVTKAREEQLWEVQRMITQLKRKYKTVQKLEQKSLDEEIIDSESNCSTLKKESLDKSKDNVSAEEDKDTIDYSEHDFKIMKPDRLDTLKEMLIYQELLNMQALLKSRIMQEKYEIQRLNEMLAERVHCTEIKKFKEKNYSPNEAEMTAMIQLSKENQLLEKKMTTLIRSIIEEKDACVELRVKLAVHKITAK